MTFQEIKSLLNTIDNPVDKLETVMELGKSLAPIPDNAQCYEIKGCSSYVEICKNGNNFFGKADSVLVRGIVAIIISIVNGKNVEEIKKMDLRKEFNSLNLNLGAGRLNGVNSMISFLEKL